MKSVSKDLLTVKGDGSSKAIIKSLMDEKTVKSREKPNIFKIEKSPLLQQLEQFLPKMKSSNMELSKKTKEELEELDIENVDQCSKVIEMNFLLEEMSNTNESSNSSGDSDSENEDSSNTKISSKTLIVPGILNKSPCGKDKNIGKKLIEEMN